MELILGGAARRHPAATPTGSAVTIGNFDGLHLGHQALMQRLDDVARTEGLRRVVLTFEPLPREVFSPTPVPRLMSLREKAAWLAASGLVDELRILRFNSALATQPAEDFVRDILVGKLHVRHVLIGDDFRFGYARRGDFTLLQRMGAKHGFSVESTPQVMQDGERISSTLVRAALSEGRLDDAARLLGHPYSLCARVTHGDKRGRLLGFPTLNLPLGRKHFALHGVYAVEILGLTDRPLPGVANAGIRPTVGGLTPRVEAHIFDWSGDAYGQRVEVRFRAFIREERRFTSLDELVKQIAKDAAAARDLLTGKIKANRK
ncbi:MAG: bifunctional riboflavin kinase/FAD synthetase [Gammaproteobacteria bacterium]|nr:bifunctional riboflavin kinase/FAD synthetase [Gammaproteobacteria bacterium]